MFYLASGWIAPRRVVMKSIRCCVAQRVFNFDMCAFSSAIAFWLIARRVRTFPLFSSLRNNFACTTYDCKLISELASFVLVQTSERIKAQLCLLICTQNSQTRKKAAQRISLYWWKIKALCAFYPRSDLSRFINAGCRFPNRRHLHSFAANARVLNTWSFFLPGKPFSAQCETVFDHRHSRYSQRFPTRIVTFLSFSSRSCAWCVFMTSLKRTTCHWKCAQFSSACMFHILSQFFFFHLEIKN